MAISMDLRVLARKLEKSSDDLLVSASTKGPETFEKVATAVAAASTLLESVADDMDQNAEFNITPEQLDEIAALASVFDESNDPLLKKQASVLDELLLSIAAPKNAVKQSRKVTEDEINRLRAERRRARGEEAYVKPRQDHHDMWNAAQQAKAVEQQVKRYRPLEAPLQTRYPPDRPGGQMTRITDHVYQDIVTGVIYDFKAGYTTQKGNKVPGSSVENQTRQLGDYRNQSTSLFETRESLMGRYASNGDLHHLKKYAMDGEIAAALKAVRDLAPQMLDKAIDKAREDGLSTSEIGEILGDVASAEVTDMFRSVLEGTDFDPTDLERFKSEERMLSSEESEDSYRKAVQLLSTLSSAGWDSMVRDHMIEMEISGMRPEYMKALHETFIGGAMPYMEPARVSIVPEHGPHTEGLTMPARYTSERHSLVALALSAIQELTPHLLKAAVAKAKAEGLADTQIKYVLSSDFNTKFKEASFGEEGEIKAAESLLPHLKVLGWTDLVKSHLKVMGSLGVNQKVLRKLAQKYSTPKKSYNRLRSLFRYAGAAELELEEGSLAPLELEFDPYQARSMNPLEPEEAGGLQTGEIMSQPVNLQPEIKPAEPSPRQTVQFTPEEDDELEGQSYNQIADTIAQIGHTKGFRAAVEAINAGGFDLNMVSEALEAESYYDKYGKYEHEGLQSFLFYAIDKQLWRNITQGLVESIAQDFGKLWPNKKDEAFNLMKEAILRAGNFLPASQLVAEEFGIAVGDTDLLNKFKKWMSSKTKEDEKSDKYSGPVTPFQDLEEWTKTFREVKEQVDKSPMIKTWVQMSKSGQRDQAIKEYRDKINEEMNARGFVGAYEKNQSFSMNHNGKQVTLEGVFFKDLADDLLEEATRPEIPSAKSSKFFKWDEFQKESGITVPQDVADKIEKDANTAWGLFREKLEVIYSQFKFKQPTNAAKVLKEAISESRRYIISRLFEDAGLPLPWGRVKQVSIPKFIAQMEQLGDIPEKLREERKRKELSKRITSDNIPDWYTPPRQKTFIEDQNGYLEYRKKAYEKYPLITKSIWTDLQTDIGKANSKARDEYMQENGYAPLSHRLFGNKTIDSMLSSADKTDRGRRIPGQTSSVLPEIPKNVVSLISNPKDYIFKYRELFNMVSEKIPIEPYESLKDMKSEDPATWSVAWRVALSAAKYGSTDVQGTISKIENKLDRRGAQDVSKDINNDLVKKIVEQALRENLWYEKVNNVVGKIMDKIGYYNPNKAIVGTKTSAQLFRKPKRFIPQSKEDLPLENPDIYED